jgi:nitrogen fixation protein FixH
MKFNWGTGIAVFIAFFVILCIVFIVYSTTQRWSMVEDDYYPKELRHEEKLVKMRNAGSLAIPLKIEAGAGSVSVRFPEYFRGKDLKGDILVYRPSDETGDFHVKVQPDSNLVCRIPFSRLKHGKYIIKVEWSADNSAYYQEQAIFIP